MACPVRCESSLGAPVVTNMRLISTNPSSAFSTSQNPASGQQRSEARLAMTLMSRLMCAMAIAQYEFWRLSAASTFRSRSEAPKGLTRDRDPVNIRTGPRRLDVYSRAVRARRKAPQNSLTSRRSSAASWQ